MEGAYVDVLAAPPWIRGGVPRFFSGWPGGPSRDRRGMHPRAPPAHRNARQLKSMFVIAIVVVGMIAGMSVGVGVFRRSSQNKAFNRPEISPRKCKYPAAQQQVQQVHVGRVVRTQTQKMPDQLNHAASL